MTKDEARSSVMGAISMALKDPTLQQGFEIICKNLSDLEETNAKLQSKIDDWQSEYIELENFKNNEIAELKEQIKKLKCCEMCKHKKFNWGFSSICEARDNIKIENPLTCKCDKWEIKEND